MLRRIVQLVAAVLVVLGAGLVFVGVTAPGVQALILGLVILISVRYERWRDRAKAPASGPHWQSTGERFEDPASGKTVEVQYNTETGERRYRRDDNP